MPTQDEQQRVLREQHKEAFKAALFAAAGATPDIVADPKHATNTIWVSFGGRGDDGFWVYSNLRNTHMPEMFIGSTVYVGHVYEGDDETHSCHVLDEDVAPNKTRDYEHLAGLAINAIRAHVHTDDEDEDE